MDINCIEDRLPKEILDNGVVVNFYGSGLKFDDEESIRPICEALEQHPDVTILCLQGNTLGSQAAKYLQKSLEKCPKLERILFEDIFTGRMKADIPLSLNSISNGLITANAKLMELDFGGNAFGELAINALFKLLTSETCFTLKEFKFNNTGLGPTGGIRLAQALNECYSKSGGQFLLEIFYIGRSRLENGGATALSKFFANQKELREVIIPQNGIFYEGISDVIQALKNCPNLEVLNINDNILTVDGAKVLAESLPKLSNLKVLNVGDCVLKNEGALIVADSLKSLKNLEELYLGHNEILTDGGLAIVRALRDLDHISLVELDGNSFGSSGIQAIEEEMEAMGKIEALCAFSDDDWSEDEDGSDEDDAFSFEDFALQPTLDNLLQLEDPAESAKAYLDNFQCLSHESLLRLFIKIASACDGSDAAVEIAVACCTPIMEKLFSIEFEEATLLNLFCLHIGFVKDEAKIVKPPKDLSGCLMVLSHFRDYYPPSMRTTFKVFVDHLSPSRCSPDMMEKISEAFDGF